MKILLIARGVPNRHDPQEGCFEMDQARALSNAGHDVVVMAIDPNLRKFWRPLGLSKSDFGSVKAYKLFLFPSNIFKILGFFQIYLKIQIWQARWLYKRILKKHGDFDILHAHFFQSIAVAADLKNKFGCRIIGTEHWSEIAKDTIPGNLVQIGKRIYSECDVLLAVSLSLKQNILKHFGIDSLVMHNMIGEEFCETSSDKAAVTDKFRFVTTGSLIPRKNHAMLIEAFRLSGLAGKAELIIIGDGPLKNDLTRQIEEAGLSDSISLVGKKAKKDIIGLLQSADAFVFPSNNENFSVAVLEAQSCGLPVIATVCGGIRECIDDSTGILVNVKDVEAMRMALIAMQNNPGQFNREHIRDLTLKRFSPSIIADKLIDIYRQVKNRQK